MPALIRVRRRAGVATGGVMLFGSSLLPATIPDGKGGTWQLGDVVRFAYEASGWTVAEWNATPAIVREVILVIAAYAMREGKTCEEIASALDAALEDRPPDPPAGTYKQPTSGYPR